MEYSHFRATRTEPVRGAEGASSVHKTLAILETVSDLNGASARMVADALGIPLPTVYRLAKSLVRSGYLVHLRDDGRFELGEKVLRLGAALHRQVSVPVGIRAQVTALHERLGGPETLYVAYRGTENAVGYRVVDGTGSTVAITLADCAHATAIGKVLLAQLSVEGCVRYLQENGMSRFTAATITDRAQLSVELAGRGRRTLHWEREEYSPGRHMVAIGVYDSSGRLHGAVGVGDLQALSARRRTALDPALRETGARIEAFLRGAGTAEPVTVQASRG